MISANDTTILAMLSRYPDMPSEEADGYIARVQDANNVPICHAVLGRIDSSDLDEESRKVYFEFSHWATDRTRRMREEELSARRRQKETRRSLRMKQLHEQGIISDEVLLLYGISGEMPSPEVYAEMSREERLEIFQSRIENKFGPQWQRQLPFIFRKMPFLTRIGYEPFKVDWIREGF